MYILDISLIIIGFGLLIYGFIKNSRNILLIAALTLFLGGGFASDFIQGFEEGYTESRAQESTSLNAPSATLTEDQQTHGPRHRSGS